MSLKKPSLIVIATIVALAAIVAVALAASQVVDASKYSVRKLGTNHYRITYTPYTTTTSTTTSATQTLNCFAAPGACGYPDPNYGTAGSTTPCGSLTASGSVTASTPGQTVSNLNITGFLTITAPNVTVNNVCVTADGNSGYSTAAVSLQGTADNTLLSNVTLGGLNNTNQSVESAVINRDGGTATLSHGYLHNCGECIHDSWTVNDSYVISDGMQGTGDHVEVVYFDSPGGGSYNHDVLLNPRQQTAVIFGDNYAAGACATHLTVTNSLLAGGQNVIESCGGGKSTGVGTSTGNISNNNWARCTTPPFTFVTGAGGGGWLCSGATSIGSQWTNNATDGGDSHGYWALAGFVWPSGIQYCPPVAGQVFTGNVYDDNGAAVSCLPFGG